MGLREKAYRFKEEHHIEDSILDRVQNPADSEFPPAERLEESKKDFPEAVSSYEKDFSEISKDSSELSVEDSLPESEAARLSLEESSINDSSANSSFLERLDQREIEHNSLHVLLDELFAVKELDSFTDLFLISFISYFHLDNAALFVQEKKGLFNYVNGRLPIAVDKLSSLHFSLQELSAVVDPSEKALRPFSAEEFGKKIDLSLTHILVLPAVAEIQSSPAFILFEIDKKEDSLLSSEKILQNREFLHWLQGSSRLLSLLLEKEWLAEEKRVSEIFAQILRKSRESNFPDQSSLLEMILRAILKALSEDIFQVWTLDKDRVNFHPYDQKGLYFSSNVRLSAELFAGIYPREDGLFSALHIFDLRKKANSVDPFFINLSHKGKYQSPSFLIPWPDVDNYSSVPQSFLLFYDPYMIQKKRTALKNLNNNQEFFKRVLQKAAVKQLDYDFFSFLEEESDKYQKIYPGKFQVMRFNFKNLNRFQNLYGQAQSKAYLQKVLQFLSEQNFSERILRISFQQFILFISAPDLNEAEKKAQEIFVRLKQIDRLEDFQIIITYELLQSGTDFQSGAELVALLTS